MGSNLSNLASCSTRPKSNSYRLLFNTFLIHPSFTPNNQIPRQNAEYDNKCISYVLCEQPKSNKYIVFAQDRNSNINDVYEMCKNMSIQNEINVIVFDYPVFLRAPESYTNTEIEKIYCESLNTMIGHMINNLNINKDNIYLVGYSLGTGIVVDYVCHNEWNNQIMLISPFASMPFMIDYDKFENYFESYKKVDKITCPVMIVHSKDDEIIDFVNSGIVLDNITNKMEHLWLSKCNHSNTIKMIPESKWEYFLNYIK